MEFTVDHRNIISSLYKKEGHHLLSQKSDTGYRNFMWFLEKELSKKDDIEILTDPENELLFVLLKYTYNGKLYPVDLVREFKRVIKEVKN